jgi:DNA-binding CsgD family transcriptional regulator
MQFRHEKLIEREIEIAQYMLQGDTLTEISLKTGLSKRHVAAHIKNMITKLKVENAEALIKLLKPLKKE